MRFMLMMHTPAGTGDYQVGAWAPQDFAAHIAFMHQFNKELTNAGEFVAAEGLAPPRDAKLVRADSVGAPITDGPFAETKEFLAGFWIVEVDRTERAYELAARVSTAPGPGGVPLNLRVEVRQVMQGPPQDA